MSMVAVVCVIAVRFVLRDWTRQLRKVRWLGRLLVEVACSGTSRRQITRTRKWVKARMPSNAIASRAAATQSCCET